MIENTEKLSAAKDDNLFRYILRVEVFAARDKDEWEFIKYQMRILENMLEEMYPSPQPPIALIFREHDSARADPSCPCTAVYPAGPR